MNKNTEAGTDAFSDKPDASHIKSIQGAWQRAADKHGVEYANDIFPIGNPVTDAGNVPRQIEQGEPNDIISHLLVHAKDDLRLAELTASRASLWNLAEACKNAHDKIMEAFTQL